MPRRVAVIGGGWAGLAAAQALCRRGVPTVVFEAARQLGGRARRVNLDGHPLDNGQHILIGAYGQTLQVLRLAGVDLRRALHRRPLDLHYADGFRLSAPRLPAPLHLGVALARARGLSWGDRLGALRFMRALRAQGFDISPDRPVEALLAEHHQGPAVCRHLWHPLCISALNTPPQRASSAVFAAVLRDSLAGGRADSDLLIPRLDLGALFADPLAADIERHGGQVRLGAPVRRIAQAGSRFRLEPGDEDFAAVIVATAPQHAAALLEDARLGPVRECLSALEYQPIVTCYLQYGQHCALPSPMLGFAEGWMQWLFDRGQLDGPKGLFAAVISAEGAHREVDQAELARRVHDQIALCIPGIAAPDWARSITEKRATFSCDAGVKRPAQRTLVPGLVLAGDYVKSDYPGTLETAVRSGISAADLIRL